MKSAWIKGALVALLHVTIILSLGGKLLYDRARCPRVWVATGWVDPDLPIRGRYINLQLRVQAPWFKSQGAYVHQDVRLSVENNQLIASKSDSPTGISIGSWPRIIATDSWLLDEPVAFFIPEHATIPFPSKAGEELWVEVTVPKNGRPRPIQAAIKHGAEWHPLDLR